MIRPSTPEGLPALLEHGVAGRLDDHAMEGDVVLDEAVHVASARRGPHRLELGLQHLDLAVELLRRLLRRELLEDGADGVDLDQLGLAEAPDTGAAERLRLDEPQELEVAERLAHGRLARAELGRDPRLDEPLAGLELPAHDAVEQDVLHLLAQHRPRDRAHDDVLTPVRPPGFVSEPTPSISIVISSPGCSRRCGSRKTPTPAGVPVRMRSPCSSVVVCVT